MGEWLGWFQFSTSVHLDVAQQDTICSTFIISLLPFEKSHRSTLAPFHFGSRIVGLHRFYLDFQFLVLALFDVVFKHGWLSFVCSFSYFILMFSYGRFSPLGHVILPISFVYCLWILWCSLCKSYLEVFFSRSFFFTAYLFWLVTSFWLLISQSSTSILFESNGSKGLPKNHGERLPS